MPDGAGDHVTELFAWVFHAAHARMGLSRKYAEPRIQHAGRKLPGEILECQAHIWIIDSVAFVSANDRHRPRLIGEPLDQEAEVFTQGGGKIDRMDKARPQLPVLDFADGIKF